MFQNFLFFYKKNFRAENIHGRIKPWWSTHQLGNREVCGLNPAYPIYMHAIKKLFQAKWLAYLHPKEEELKWLEGRRKEVRRAFFK